MLRYVVFDAYNKKDSVQNLSRYFFIMGPLTKNINVCFLNGI